jgi:hypothetical protein
MRYELPTMPDIDAAILKLLGSESHPMADPHNRDPRRRIQQYTRDIATAAQAVTQCTATHDFDPERAVDLIQHLSSTYKRVETALLMDLSRLFPPGPLPWERPRGHQSPDERPSRNAPLPNNPPAADFPTDDPRRRIHHCTSIIAAAAAALKDSTANDDFDPERVVDLMDHLRRVQGRYETAMLVDLSGLFPPGPLPWERPRGPQSPDEPPLDHT